MKTRSRFPRSFWFTLGMTLVAGCGSGLPSGSLGDPATLSGQIAGWKYGPGHTLVAARFGWNWPQIASAPIDAEGRFRITLPSLAELRKEPNAIGEREESYDPAPHCTGRIQSNTNVYGWSPVVFSFSGKHSGGIVYSNKATPDIRLTEARFFYSDRSFWQDGTLNCKAPEVFDGQGSYDGYLSYAVSYEAGLNRVFISRSRLLPSMPSNHYVTGDTPPGVQWVLETDPTDPGP